MESHCFGVKLTCMLLILASVQEVRGHGYLMTPPGRSSLWRAGFSAPINYNDMELNCGGLGNLWGNNGGRCGTCGDPYQGPLANDDGGRYDNGVIGRLYRQGDVIDIDVVITANHLGYFVLRLCEDGSLSKEPLQTCLNKHVLTLGTPSGDVLRYYIGNERKTYRFKATLPHDVTCRHCVLQWDYRTGNNWGSDKEGTGKGFGPQEHFINCADIRIDSADGAPPSQTTTTSMSTTASPTESTTSTTTLITTSVATSATTSSTSTLSTTSATTTTKPTSPTTTSTTITSPTTSPMTTISPTTTPPSTTNPRRGCRSIGLWAGQKGMDQWCVVHCSLGFCPDTHCICY